MLASEPLKILKRAALCGATIRRDLPIGVRSHVLGGGCSSMTTILAVYTIWWISATIIGAIPCTVHDLWGRWELGREG